MEMGPMDKQSLPSLGATLFREMLTSPSQKVTIAALVGSNLAQVREVTGLNPSQPIREQLMVT